MWAEPRVDYLFVVTCCSLLEGSMRTGELPEGQSSIGERSLAFVMQVRCAHAPSLSSLRKCRSPFVRDEKGMSKSSKPYYPVKFASFFGGGLACSMQWGCTGCSVDEVRAKYVLIDVGSQSEMKAYSHTT